MKNLVLAAAAIVSTTGYAQLAVKSGTALGGTAELHLHIKGDVALPAASATTDFSKWNLTLNGAAQKVTAAGSVSLADLATAAAGNKTLSGNWTVTRNLSLNKGVILVSATPGETGKLTYTGNKNLGTTGSADSYVNGALTVKSSGSDMFFPIGNIDGYAPVGLREVKDNTARIQLEAVKGNPGLTTTADIKEFFTSRYWDFKLESGNFEGTPVRLGIGGTKDFSGSGEAGDLIVVEVSENGTLNNLGASDSNSDVVESGSPSTAKPKTFALAKSNIVTVDITRFITPNSLDEKNNVLFIRNIEFFPENTVTLLDRWGVTVMEWKNFSNYTTSSAVQNDFDFTKLVIGNYVCVLEYKDKNSSKPKKILQMISVVK